MTTDYAAPHGAAPAAAKPNSHMFYALVATVVFFLPLGVVAVAKAAQVGSLWSIGQYAEAQRTADSAKRWANWSVAVAVGFWVLVLGLYVVLAGVGIALRQ